MWRSVIATWPAVSVQFFPSIFFHTRDVPRMCYAAFCCYVSDNKDARFHILMSSVYIFVLTCTFFVSVKAR